MSTEEHDKPGDQMGNGNSAQPEDGAPPVPPKELPEWRPEDRIVPSARPTSVPTPAATPAPPPRFKKKVPWKGKNIMVLLPHDDERGRNGQALAPMTEEEVKGMLAKWEDAGYDTAGFNLGQSEIVEEDGSLGQSRSVWPLAADMQRSREEGSFRVSIPDRGGKLRYFYYLFMKRWKTQVMQYLAVLRRI